MTTIYSDFSKVIDYIFRSDSLRDPFTQNLRKYALNSLIKYKENVLAAYVSMTAIKSKFTPIFLLFR